MHRLVLGTLEIRYAVPNQLNRYCQYQKSEDSIDRAYCTGS